MVALKLSHRAFFSDTHKKEKPIDNSHWHFVKATKMMPAFSFCPLKSIVNVALYEKVV